MPKIRDMTSPEMTDEHFDTLYDVLHAINDLPHVRSLVEAYMRGRGCEDPAEQIDALHKLW